MFLSGAFLWWKFHLLQDFIHFILRYSNKMTFLNESSSTLRRLQKRIYSKYWNFFYFSFPEGDVNNRKNWSLRKTKNFEESRKAEMNFWSISIAVEERKMKTSVCLCLENKNKRKSREFGNCKEEYFVSCLTCMFYECFTSRRSTSNSFRKWTYKSNYLNCSVHSLGMHIRAL